MNGAELLLEAGATRVTPPRPTASVGSGHRRLKNSQIEQVVVTKHPAHRARQAIDKLVVLSIAPTIAQKVKAVFEEGSVSELFHGGEPALVVRRDPREIAGVVRRVIAGST